MIKTNTEPVSIYIDGYRIRVRPLLILLRILGLAHRVKK
jgi:hypothetical protein